MVSKNPCFLALFTVQRTVVFGTSLYALPPCPPLYDFSATPQSFLPPELEPLGFSSIGQLRVAS